MFRAFLIVVAMVLAAGAAAAKGDMVTGLVTMPSKHTVNETIDRLEAKLKSKGMTIFARINHSEEAQKVGLKMPPTQLLIFGNPKGGTLLMLASPVTAIDLPMKALAWKDGNGKVWLSYNTATYLKERDHIPGKDEAISKLDGFLHTIMTKAAE
jgi:uncharacterized protein (DUF302 family)